jgi:hypothetical protein
MSLDNIQLSSYLLHNLYNKSLVDLKPEQEITDSLLPTTIKYLGKNDKQLTILVRDEENVFLDDENLNFLIRMMSACQVTLADMALVNIDKQKQVDYQSIMQELKPEKIIFFGPEPQQLSFPLQFPQYQVQRYNKQVYLSAPALDILKNNKEEKTKLWACLQQLFPA